MLYFYLLMIIFCGISARTSVHKVIVPSVHKEWLGGSPDWVTNVDLQKQHNYSVFLYQKNDPSAPNYISMNRGTEAGVYLRYIVDHYNNFPDIAVFVHAHPAKHQPKWFELLDCIHPQATFMNFNTEYICRDTTAW